MATDFQPRSDNFLALGPHGFHGVHYLDWGYPNNAHIVVCAHGLTRNAHDFDYFASALAADCRLVCPDMPGRGRSDWLQHKEDYGYAVYVNDCATLIACISAAAGGPEQGGRKVIDWVGTSMGGIIGMTLAAQPGSPIRRLVVNDVGAMIPKAALQRIADYVGRDLRFATIEELERHLRFIAAPFGPLTDEQWRHLVQHGSTQLADGTWTFSYDPGIAVPLRTDWDRDLDLWGLWDAIRCPTLIVRGADSDLLLKETAEAMLTRGPKARLVEFPGVGHAPTLMSEDQIGAVRDFLLEP
jgi:pimeloyl-ACP methyl ester carboxylesterase